MARQVHIMESVNTVVDLTTDNCNEDIIPEVPVNSVDNDVKTSVVTLTDINNTEDDVVFLGMGTRYVPVITISDSDVFEDDIINNSDTVAYTEKANSTMTVKNISEQSEGCRILKGKSCFIEKIESKQMTSMKTATRAKQAVTETVVSSACRNEGHHSENSKHNMQVQNTKKEILTKGSSPKSKICETSKRSGDDENGAKEHRKKRKIKVRVTFKKPGSGMDAQQPQDTVVTDEVKAEDSNSHKLYHITSKGVTRKGIQNVSSKTDNEGILTQNRLTGNKNTVNKEHVNLEKESRSSENSDKLNVCKKDTITKSVAKEGIGKNVSDTSKKLNKIEDSYPWHQTKSNGGHEDNKKIREIHKKTIRDHLEESSTLCSQLAICSATVSLHNAQGDRGESHNENIEAAISDEQNEDSIQVVEVLPARMRIKDCESKVVYAVPLLRLPVEKQVVYFSPAYIEVFLNKVRDVFSVERFLRAIPDPFNYFRNERIKEKRFSDECLALMYLKSKYRRIPFPDIMFIFEKNRCSLTLTCEELDIWKSSWKRTIRKSGLGCGCLKPHELSIRFIREVTFIENKHKIESHLQSKKRKKATAFEIAKLRGELQRCGHCGVRDLLIEDMAPCSVSHMFCKICIQNTVDRRLRKCENPFACLNKGCQWLFSMKALKKAVKPVTFSSLLHIRHLKEMEAAGVKLLETCPYCGFADIPSKDDEVFCCLNLDCMRETCRQCKGPSHTPYPCVMALQPQVEKPCLLMNRCVLYQNQFQSTEMQQNTGSVQEKSLVLQQPQPLMQYPQQPLMYYQQSSVHHSQEPLVNHQQPLMNNPLEPQNTGSVQEKSLVLQQPQPLMQYPQQPLMYYQQPSMFRSQEPLVNHQQPLMNNPLEPLIHQQQPLLAPLDDPLLHYPQRSLVHLLQSPALQGSCPPLMPAEHMMRHLQPSQ